MPKKSVRSPHKAAARNRSADDDDALASKALDLPRNMRHSADASSALGASSPGFGLFAIDSIHVESADTSGPTDEPSLAELPLPVEKGQSVAPAKPGRAPPTYGRPHSRHSIRGTP